VSISADNCLGGDQVARNDCSGHACKGLGMQRISASGFTLCMTSDLATEVLAGCKPVGQLVQGKPCGRPWMRAPIPSACLPAIDSRRIHTISCCTTEQLATELADSFRKNVDSETAKKPPGRRRAEFLAT
jgi:hypothetical protein